MKATVFRFVPPLVALVIFIASWELLVRALHTPAFLLPPPSAIATAASSDAPTLLRAMATTAKASFLGFGVSAVLGVVLAILLATSRIVERAFYPYTVFLQTVPIVAIAPLLVIWFGPGLRAVAVAAVIVSLFPVIANVLAGLRSVDPSLRDLFQLYGASRWQRLWHLELPSAIPSTLTGLRVASGLSVIGAVVGEFVAGFSEGNAGLGITILASYRQLRTDLLFAAVLLSTLLGLIAFSLVNALSWFLLRRWHIAEKS